MKDTRATNVHFEMEIKRMILISNIVNKIEKCD